MPQFVLQQGVACGSAAAQHISARSALEGFFGAMKCEMFYGRDWTGVTLDELEERINSYIEWHNARRIKRSLGGMSPLQYRESLGLAA